MTPSPALRSALSLPLATLAAACVTSLPDEPYAHRLEEFEDHRFAWSADLAVDAGGPGVELAITARAYDDRDGSPWGGGRIQVISPYVDIILGAAADATATELEGFTAADGTFDFVVWVQDVPRDDAGEILETSVVVSIPSDTQVLPLIAEAGR